MSNISIFKTTSLLVCLGVAACGGGGSDGGDDTHQISGKIIDGYISGATVYLDFNNNGELDSDEPFVTSTETGDYSLELTDDQQACLDYVPLIVDVPVGAIDAENGEVEEAYQMSFPPRTGLTDAEKYITPLTSMLWDSVKEQLAQDFAEQFTAKNCHGIRENQQLVNSMIEMMAQSKSELIRTYNLSEQQIFGDYIANDDSEAHALALLMVQGLQRAFKERAQFAAQGYYSTYYIYELVDYGTENEGWNLSYWMGKEMEARENVSFFTSDFSHETILEYSDARRLTTGEYNNLGIFLSEANQLRGNSDNGFTCSFRDVFDYDDVADNGWATMSREFVGDTVTLPADCSIDSSRRANGLEQEYIVYRQGTSAIRIITSPLDSVFSQYSFDVEDPDSKTQVVLDIMDELKAGTWRWNESDALSYSEAGSWTKYQITTDSENRTVIASRSYEEGQVSYDKQFTLNSDGTYQVMCASDPGVALYDQACSAVVPYIPGLD